MASNSGFYKGEKKKPKKNKDVKNLSFGDVTPTYVMPEVITKKREEK